MVGGALFRRICGATSQCRPRIAEWGAVLEATSLCIVRARGKGGATDGKFRQEEGLAERSGLSCRRIAGRVRPKCPSRPGVGITQIAVFVLAVVLVEAGFARKGVEAHRTILGIVEEGRVVAPFAQDSSSEVKPLPA